MAQEMALLQGHLFNIRKVNFHESLQQPAKDEEQGWTRPSVAYGPYYRDSESHVWEERKKSILRHVATLCPTELPETVDGYMEAVKRVENQARALYADQNSLNQLSTNEFKWMMIKDGCLMLVVALFSLGGKKQLQFPPNDPMFGDQWNKEQVKLAISSMFYVGNQIPFVVLRELMRQSFFQRVLNSRKWKRPMDLPRRALYDFLVVPMFNTGFSQLNSLIESIQPLQYLTRWYDHFHPPSDILHGLHQLLVGPSNFLSETKNDGDDDNYFDDCSAVRSATELRQAGIFFKYNKEMGTRGIRFGTSMFNGVLSLPPITVNSDTELLMQNLIHYEATQQLPENKREVSAYLEFMRELLRSPEDVKVLATHGIILADPKHEEELPNLLRKLPISGVKENCNLHLVRDQIRNYSQPGKWERLRNLISLVLVVSLCETFYTILGYYNKTK